MNANKRFYKLGIDIGSTTLKMIILDHANNLIYKAYRRHNANINQLFIEEIETITRLFPGQVYTIHITGSAGMGISERLGISFTQEVVASIEVIQTLYPNIRTMIDLGGEDAKMVFFKAGKQPDIRMNGSCAGGTGAFIDQMADLMHIPIEELGTKALAYEKIYPVASRCGVFAKTDVQNLISRNVPVSDISKSILHAVALQSITSLARGYDMETPVLCIGGPLTFLPALRDSFCDALGIDPADMITPDNSAFFPAWGCAMLQEEKNVTSDLSSLLSKLKEAKTLQPEEHLSPLFHSDRDYCDWKANRKIKRLKRTELGESKEIGCYLGIDSGSTTTKLLIMDEDENIVYTYYTSNQGNPLKRVLEGLAAFRRQAEERGVVFRFIASASTGYGEDLVKSALNLDYGIVETLAHLTGAQYVDPEVSFVLDIGGQDIKSIFVRNGIISNIELNEACSSGCGSFLQNSASSMHMSLEDFTAAACHSQYPRDLGSRCTVFMNSKVKQSLRENAEPGDIAAGLAYSVVKNCLFKVLKISNLNLLGEHIVVQGGTFRNDAVYRALELLSGKSVSTTDYPELMGALGAALYARKMQNQTQRQTHFPDLNSLPDIHQIDTKELQCKGCTNKCAVLRFRFENGNLCYAGNKCEKVFFNKSTAPAKGFNAFDMKNELLFNRDKTVSEQANIRGTIGIPRILNMYENYPFWHTLFTACGFRVVLSPESSFSLYQKGVGSIMSDNICFPAKLAHGHILALIDKGVDRIFYPIVQKEEQELKGSSNSYNCPVVSGYPDVIRSSMDPYKKHGIHLDKPVISFCDKKVLEKGCSQYFTSLGVEKEVFQQAFEQALKAKEEVKHKLRNKQRVLLDEGVKKQELVFIVAGRPYHADSLIQQKVGQILADLGIQVLTDDVFCQDAAVGFSKLSIVSQWSYPNRVVQAAIEVAKLPQNVQLIQLNSFGCGPDSFFMDETGELLKQAGKNHTIIRIDEIASPGSIRLRLRSFIESLKARHHMPSHSSNDFNGYPASYTKKDKKKTILVPWFADFFSPFVPAIGELIGYKMVNLPRSTKESAEKGLKYGHNEVCYPSTLILGDIITGLQSGKYDIDNSVVMISQTGGQCRATNYIAQIKNGLKNAGFSHIPVLVASTGEVYQNKQKEFKVPVLKIINIIAYALLYADAIQQMYSTCIVREKKKGESRQVFDFYIERGVEAVSKNNHQLLLKLLEQAVADFNQIAVHERTFTKVGLIGEIYVKYNNYGQAYITDWLRERNMEVVTPPIIDFVMQYFVNSAVNIKNGLKKRTFVGHISNTLFWNYMQKKIARVENQLKTFRFYQPSESIFTKAKYAAEILDLSHQFGEGWTIAGEVASYARQGIKRVVCIQPFGCIANHVVAKGIEKRLKKFYPDMNLLYLDVDGGMAEVNLQNRLHFLIS